MSIGALSAGTMTVDLGGFSFNTVQLVNSIPATGTFQQFDPTLGTLTGVAIGWTNENLKTVLDATAGNTGGSAIAGNSVNTDDLLLPALPTFFGFFFQNTNFGCSVSGSVEVGVCDDPETTTSLGNSNPGQALALSPSGLLAYTGTGTLPFQITPNLSFGLSTNIGSSNNVNDDVGGQDLNNATDLFLVYTFTPPVSTPEPGSLALLGGGLVLLGLTRYRKAFQARTMAPVRNPRSV